VIEMNGSKSVTATFVTPEGWLQGWTYRKPVTLSRASGAVTNYQMRLLVGETSGASGEDVDCNGHIQADFDDLRFTRLDGTTLLDYWIESITGSTPNQLATVWVEFDTIDTTATTFYMYYGNVNAPAASHGDNTFLFFDDFLGSDFDGAKWNKNVQGAHVSYAVSGSVLRTTWTAGTLWEFFVLCTDDTVSSPFRVRTRQKQEYEGAANSWTEMIGAWADSSNEHVDNAITEGALHQYYTSGNLYMLVDGGSGSYAATADKDTNWHILEWLKQSGASKLYIDGTLKHSSSNTYAEGAKYLYWMDVQATADTNITFKHMNIDWIFVSKYSPTEPAWGSWGAEEAD
jgi:hypothetical protein